MTGRRFVPLLLVALITLGGPARTHADVDLTGSWTIDAGFAGILTVEIVQSGNDLSFLVFSGTIDPTTGVFMLEAPPKPGGLFPNGVPYAPSPADTLNGVAAADGNSFSANVVTWIFKVTPPVDFQHFPWFPLAELITGTRRLLAGCGNGALDTGEMCDDGSANGTNACCSATCTVIDDDQDGVCDAEDDCPTVFDPVQSCIASMQLQSGQLGGRGRGRIRGTLSPGIGSFSRATIGVGAASRTDVFTKCIGDPTNYVKVRCTNADRSTRLRLHRATTTDDWEFKLTTHGLSASTGPISVAIEDQVNGRRASDMLTNCSVHRTRLRCLP